MFRLSVMCHHCSCLQFAGAISTRCKQVCFSHTLQQKGFVERTNAPRAAQRSPQRSCFGNTEETEVRVLCVLCKLSHSGADIVVINTAFMQILLRAQPPEPWWSLHSGLCRAYTTRHNGKQHFFYYSISLRTRYTTQTCHTNLERKRKHSLI